MFPLLPFVNLNEVAFFALVLGRLAGIFSAIPLFGGERVPMMIRVVLIFAMTLVCYPVLRTKAPQLPMDTVSLVILIMREALIGITLGIISQAVFSAVEFCGQLVGMQMGFSMASMFDPTMGQVPLMAVFQMLLATLLFLTLNIHHVFIRAIIESYSLIPPGNWHMSAGLMKFLVKTTGDIFIIGIKLAAPVMVSLLATSVVLGIMARSFPQMNIFMVSMPLNVGVGLLMLGLSLLVFLHTLQNSFGQFDEHINVLFKLFS
jgi:flagellar biosynthetic protein FliR